MSCFLFYFETSNPEANWESFQKHRLSIEQRFEIVNNRTRYKLQMFPCGIICNLKNHKAIVIHDGVSSDRIFSTIEQKAVLFDFIKENLLLESIIPNMIVSLVHSDFKNIEFDDKPTVKINLNDYFEAEREREVVYQITKV